MEITQYEAPHEVCSFSWEIVIVVGTRLEFYDSHGRLTHTEHLTADGIYYIAYDPVHNRVLFTDSNDDTGKSSIFSYEIVTRKIECLIRNTSSVTSLTYDPATELLFWVEDIRRLYSISLKPGFNSDNEKHLILTDDESNYIETIAVDSCGGFIYWISLNSGCIHRVRFNGSEGEVVMGHTVYGRFSLDQQTQTMYWDESGCFKCADLNGKNIRTIRVKPEKNMQNKLLTTSKDSLYFVCGLEFELERYIRKLPKNPQSDIYVKSKLFIKHEDHIWAIACNYKVKDLTLGLQNCEALKSLLPNSNDSLNDSTDVSQLCVQGCGEDCCECTRGYSDEENDDSVCQNCSDDEDCSQSDDSEDSDDSSDDNDDSSDDNDEEQTRCSQITALHCRRRLEVLAAFVWVISLVIGDAVSIYLFIQLVYSRFWWLGILYGVWFINDIEICSRGGRPSEWVQNWTWWRYLCDYFPIKLVKTVDLDPSKNYMFACFPHGVISVAAFRSLYTNTKRFHELFPGFTCRLIIRGGSFLVPFFRDFALALGMCSSTEESLLHLLDTKKYKGNCVCLLIGDAAEALHEHPKEYKVNLKKKGFIRDAMKSGAALVPILSFGVTGLYRPPNNPENSLLHRFQEKVRQYTGISPIFPMRALVIAVVGEPMEVKRNLEPTNEEIDTVHAEFTERLKTLFETEKVKYLKYHEEAKLIIT